MVRWRNHSNWLLILKNFLIELQEGITAEGLLASCCLDEHSGNSDTNRASSSGSFNTKLHHLFQKRSAINTQNCSAQCPWNSTGLLVFFVVDLILGTSKPHSHPSPCLVQWDAVDSDHSVLPKDAGFSFLSVELLWKPGFGTLIKPKNPGLPGHIAAGRGSDMAFCKILPPRVGI